MHGGAMVTTTKTHPGRQFLARGKTTTDQEFLRDLTTHARRNPSIYMRLTVKQGLTATDFTCGVDWPRSDDGKTSPRTPRMYWTYAAKTAPGSSNSDPYPTPSTLPGALRSVAIWQSAGTHAQLQLPPTYT